VKYRLYHAAIEKGLEKLKKYYSKFNEKPLYILALGKLWVINITKILI
jgi:hypothetical protein